VLAPQQAAVLDADRARGRARALDFVNGYLGLPNYVRNLRRLGFTDDDLRGPASDRLVDALVAYGDEDAIAARVRAHHDAGADHVCLYVLGGAAAGPRTEEALPLDAWRRLAPALTRA
jgi:probable F420-dependent oxidoreductase